jgi:hypothetical protein
MNMKRNAFKNNLGIYGILVLLVGLVMICGLIYLIPTVTIYALNELFGLGIELTPLSWMAMFWLQVLLFTKVSTR